VHLDQGTHNNLIEQDHRSVKQRVAVMLGFKYFKNAAITIAGIELMHRIRKGQFALGPLGLQGGTAPAVWARYSEADHITLQQEPSGTHRLFAPEP
jgi:DDE domain